MMGQNSFRKTGIFVLWLLAIVFVAYGAPAADAGAIIRATTLDTNHNGLLDMLEITLDREVTLPTAVAPGQITVEFESLSWQVVAISFKTGESKDSVLLISLEEIHTVQPQTDWQPVLKVSGVDEIEDLTDGIVCTDGAGPIIFAITKVVPKPDTAETLTVSFSEEYMQQYGGYFGADVTPSELFDVYRYDKTTDRMILDDGFFDLLDSFTSVVKEERGTTVQFVSPNGQDLLDRYYLVLTGETPVVDSMGTTAIAGGFAGAAPASRRDLCQTTAKNSLADKTKGNIFDLAGRAIPPGQISTFSHRKRLSTKVRVFNNRFLLF